MRRLAVLALAVCVLVFAACGDDTEPSAADRALQRAQTDTEQATTAAPAPTTTTAGGRTKPKITVPKGDPPKTLVKRDLVVGKGTPARTGDEVTVQYVGVAYSDGEEFDASWDREEPFTFTLGQGDVIKGWDQGIVGMRPGGRRQLTIPPNLAYGAQGSPPAIGPNETLIFVVDLEKVGR